MSIQTSNHADKLNDHEWELLSAKEIMKICGYAPTTNFRDTLAFQRVSNGKKYKGYPSILYRVMPVYRPTFGPFPMGSYGSFPMGSYGSVLGTFTGAVSDCYRGFPKHIGTLPPAERAVATLPSPVSRDGYITQADSEYIDHRGVDFDNDSWWEQAWKWFDHWILQLGVLQWILRDK